MELEIQKFLRNTPNGIVELEARYAIKAKRHGEYNNLVLFKYNQIDSPFHEEIVQEARGIILDEANNWNVVCYTFKKFWNVFEPLAAKIDWSTAVIQEKVDGCFEYNAPVNLFGGGKIKIGEIVNGNLSPTLIGMDRCGKLVPCYVTGRKNNGTKNLWVDLKTDAGALLPQSRSFTIKITPNHQVFVNGKYIPIGEAKPGDEIVAAQYGPDDGVLHMIRSSMLGDGSVCRNGSNYKFIEGHCEEQKDLTDAIIRWLGDCSIVPDVRISGYGSKMFRAISKTYPSLNTIREEWYSSGTKEVPADLSWVDDFSIAKWYMDDGSLAHSDKQQDRALFATNGFSHDSVKRLSDKLYDMYKVDSTVCFSKGWYLRVNSGLDNAINRLWEAIAPHIIEKLRYKLPCRFRDVPYVERPAGTEVVRNCKAKILSITPIEPIKKNFQSGRSGYDIETTTGNYMVGNVLVHNSLMQCFYYDNKWHVATSGTPDANCPINDFGITFKKLFWDEFNKFDELTRNTLSKNLCYAFELTSPFNRVVVNHESTKLTCLGARVINPESSYYLSEFLYPGLFPSTKTYDVSSLEACIETVSQFDPLVNEGVVVVDRYFNRVKIKSPKYVLLHHIKDVFSLRRMCEAVQNGEYEEVKVAMASFGQMVALMDDIKCRHEAMVKEVETAYIKLYKLPTQKEFAMAAQEYKFKSVLFSMKKHGKSANLCLCEQTVDNYMKLLRLK